MSEVKIIETDITFLHKDIIQTIDLVQTGINQYRVADAVSILTEVVRFGDVIEVKPDTNGDLIFQRIVEPSTWQSEIFTLSQEMAVSDELHILLKRVDKEGGYWEQIFGGTLIVCLPPDCVLDIKTAYQALYIS